MSYTKKIKWKASRREFCCKILVVRCSVESECLGKMVRVYYYIEVSPGESLYLNKTKKKDGNKLLYMKNFARHSEWFYLCFGIHQHKKYFAILQCITRRYVFTFLYLLQKKFYFKFIKFFFVYIWNIFNFSMVNFFALLFENVIGPDHTTFFLLSENVHKKNL